MSEWSRETKLARELRKSLMPSFDGTASAAGLLITCKRLVVLATRHHKLAENACNRELTKREEHEDAAIEKEIRELCECLPPVPDKATGEPKKVRPKFQGDPRGATVKLVMPDGRYDDWGQEGICVPTTDVDKAMER